MYCIYSISNHITFPPLYSSAHIQVLPKRKYVIVSGKEAPYESKTKYHVDLYNSYIRQTSDDATRFKILPPLIQSRDVRNHEF